MPDTWIPCSFSPTPYKYFQNLGYSSWQLCFTHKYLKFMKCDLFINDCAPLTSAPSPVRPGQLPPPLKAGEEE